MEWSFERVSRVMNGNPAYFIDADLFRKVVHIEGANVNIALVMTRQFSGKRSRANTHRYSIRAFAEEPAIPQHQTPPADEFA
jgi:hypothetical protein